MSYDNYSWSFWPTMSMALPATLTKNLMIILQFSPNTLQRCWEISYKGTLWAYRKIPKHTHVDTWTCQYKLPWWNWCLDQYLPVFINKVHIFYSFWDIQVSRILRSDWLKAFLEIIWEPDLSDLKFEQNNKDNY